jgi:hypothetical protein
MATPHVSGVAALVFAANPSLTNKDVQNILDSTAIDLGVISRDNWYGYGLINPVGAIAKATNTPLNTAPSVITDLAATAGNNLITLVWSAPNNGGSAITDYIIEFKLSSDASYTVYADGTIGSTGGTVTGLANGLSYDFIVSAVNGIGTGSASNVATATTFSAATAPSVSISNPVSGSSFLQGDAITFSATATDAEDGDISANINWESNIDGAIGTGTLISSSILSVGTHTITASITDSSGLKSSQNITVTVNSVSGLSSVDKIQYSTTGGKQKNMHLLVSVHLTDGTKNISGAAIQIQLSLNGAKYSVASGTTDSTGTMTFTINNAPSGTYHTDILSVTLVDWNGITPQNSFTKSSQTNFTK